MLKHDKYSESCLMESLVNVIGHLMRSHLKVLFAIDYKIKFVIVIICLMLSLFSYSLSTHIAGSVLHGLYICKKIFLAAVSCSKKKEICFRPGSNRRPFACEANVITTTLRKLDNNV